MMKFRIGEKVRTVSSDPPYTFDPNVGVIDTITASYYVVKVVGGLWGYREDELKPLKEAKMNEFEVGKQVYYVQKSNGRKVYGIVRCVGELPLYGRPTQMVGGKGCVWSEWDRTWDGQINSSSLGWMPKEEVFKVEGVKVSKYQELKERIKNVQGWDKEADDILSILQKEYKLAYIIRITGHNISANGDINIEEYFTAAGGWKKVYVSFSYSDQCSKLKAFKQALLWLLDHSDIKKEEKHIKIMQLKVQKSILGSQMQSLDMQIKGLENG